MFFVYSNPILYLGQILSELCVVCVEIECMPACGQCFRHVWCCVSGAGGCSYINCAELGANAQAC